MKEKFFIALTTCFLMFGMTVAVNAAPYNLLQGKPVSLTGTFFTGGWGSSYVVPGSTVVDGKFLPRSNQWDQGAVWWDDRLSPNNYINIDLGSTYIISSFIVQADDNDSYNLEYWNQLTNSWVLAWDIPETGGWGLQTRPDVNNNTVQYTLPVSISTDALRLFGEPNQGDRLFAVSEIQAFGVGAPLPGFAGLLLFASGFVGVIGRKFGLKK